MKKFKIKLMAVLAACALFCGIGIPAVMARAETVEETPIVEEVETTETVEEVDEEGILQRAYNKVKDKVETWMIAAIAAAGGISGLIFAVFTFLVRRKINKNTALTAEERQQIADNVAKETAEKVTKRLVGNAFNVNIQAEVSEAVKNFLAPVLEKFNVFLESARNTEIGEAYVMLANAHSQLLTEEERETLRSVAEKLLAHAGTCDCVALPGTVSFEEVKTETVSDVKSTKKAKANDDYVTL